MQETSQDHRVKKLSSLKPMIRNDISFTFQEFKSKPCYVIEDPLASRYYRIGLSEYKFISLLNGKRNISEIMAIMSFNMGKDALNMREVSQILGWLKNTNLLETYETQEIKIPQKKNEPDIFQKTSKVAFLKLPFGRQCCITNSIE